MFRYAKNVRLASFLAPSNLLSQAFTDSFWPLLDPSLSLSGSLLAHRYAIFLCALDVEI